MNKYRQSYKESYYNFKLLLDSGKLMIYNSKTGAITLVESEKSKTVLDVLQGRCLVENNSLLDGLLKQGYMVRDDKNEFDDIRSWHENYGQLNNVIQLTLLPAEACNFNCPYCFIYKNRNLYMKEWVYRAVFNHIVKRLAQSNKQSIVQLSWFGGEPLLASERIIAFMEEIRQLKKPYPDLIIDSALYTNAYLLTYGLFEQFIKCGITTFQVTIDGNCDHHNALRRLKTGEPTFDVIYNNLMNIRKSAPQDMKFIFYIRANFLKDSMESMESLLGRFTEDFGQDKRFHIFFRPVYHFNTEANHIGKVADKICNPGDGVMNQIDLAYNVINKLSKDALKKMVHVFNPLPRPVYSWCKGRSRNIHIIGADGAVFSCDTRMVEKEKSVGEITPDGTINLNAGAELFKKSVFEDDSQTSRECYMCKLFPVCLGGCRLANLTSGQKACFWNKEVILYSMKKYADLMSVK